MDSRDLLLIANDIRKEYNKKREYWHNNATRYFHQALTSNYITEERLMYELAECKKLKEEYCKVCDILKSRGCNYNFDTSLSIEASKNLLFVHSD